MKVRDEKLGKFIMAMNNEEAHIFLIEELASIREQHKAEREEDRWMEVENGTVKRLPVKKVVANIHDTGIETREDVAGIREDTQILRDFKFFFGFMRKYHLWWYVGIVISITLSALGLDVALNTIKNHLP